MDRHLGNIEQSHKLFQGLKLCRHNRVAVIIWLDNPKKRCSKRSIG
jgi:hypothetical protein